MSTFFNLFFGFYILIAMKSESLGCIVAIFSSGNISLEAAVNWVVEHENDPDVDEMPLV